jgi:hypothetical protein
VSNVNSPLLALPDTVWSHCLSFLTFPLSGVEVAAVELDEEANRVGYHYACERIYNLNNRIWNGLRPIALASKFFGRAVFRWRNEYNNLHGRGEWKRWSVAEEMLKGMFPNSDREVALEGKYLGLTHSYQRLEPWRSGEEIPQAHVLRIAAFLRNNEANFHRLGISNVKMHNSIAEITNVLRTNHTVSKVYFCHDCITSQEAIMLANALTSNDSIEHLDLSNPHAAEKWFVEASPAGQETTRHRQFNKIGDVAARALVEAVLPKAKFTLDLRGNPISKETAVALKELMSLHGKTLLI